MTDWSNWRPLNIQSSERSEALLATKTVFKTLQHNRIDHLIFPKRGLRDTYRFFGFLPVIDQHRTRHTFPDFGRAAEGLRLMVDDAADVTQDHFAILGRGGANGKAQDGVARDHIAGIARQKCTNRHDRTIGRCHVACDNALNCHNDGRARHHRVNGQFRDAAVATFADDLDLPIINSRHHLAGMEVELALLKAWNVVHAEHRIDWKTLEEA